MWLHSLGWPTAGGPSPAARAVRLQTTGTLPAPRLVGQAPALRHMRVRATAHLGAAAVDGAVLDPWLKGVLPPGRARRGGLHVCVCVQQNCRGARPRVQPLRIDGRRRIALQHLGSLPCTGRRPVRLGGQLGQTTLAGWRVTASETARYMGPGAPQSLSLPGEPSPTQPPCARPRRALRSRAASQRLRQACPHDPVNMPNNMQPALASLGRCSRTLPLLVRVRTRQS